MINAQARLGSRHEREIRDAFTSAGWEVLSAPLDGSTAVEIIEGVREPFDVAVIGGGDGTIMASLGAFVGRPIPLGIIPLGTFNDLARALEIPLRPAAAVEAIVSGRRRAIDVGCVNGHYFLTEASIGISTHIARRQTSEIKRFLGLASAIATTVTTIWYARPFSASVLHDGEDERFKTIQLTVANSFHFGGLITNRTASLEDGKL
jgi:diacylglycerol kinase (ATP)